MKISLNVNKPLLSRKIAFTSNEQKKPLFTDLKVDAFEKSNPNDVLNDFDPAYALRHETTEIDYDRFKVDFKKIMGKEFNGDYQDLRDIPVPEISNKYRVVQDSYMIGFVHLLVVPKEPLASFANCQQQDGNDFEDTILKTVQTLKKMYPDRNIYYAEHGSGMIDGKEEQAGTSLSVSHAHGHFFIPFKPGQPPFEEVLNPYFERLLKGLGWSELDKKSQKSDKVIPDYNQVYSKVSDKLGKNIKGNPYLHIGVFDKNNSESSKIYIKTSKDDKTPSQILRVLYHSFLSQNRDKLDRVNWDWKLATKYLDREDKYKPQNEEDEINHFTAVVHNSFISGNRIRFWVRFLEYLENKDAQIPEYSLAL